MAAFLVPNSRLIGRIAEDEGEVVGFNVSMVHDGTWVPGPVCYLEDLFVDPTWTDGRGLGQIDSGPFSSRAREELVEPYWDAAILPRLLTIRLQTDDFVRYVFRLWGYLVHFRQCRLLDQSRFSGLLVGEIVSRAVRSPGFPCN